MARDYWEGQRQKYTKDKGALKSEIARAERVQREREKAGLQTEDQRAYIEKLRGIGKEGRVKTSEEVGFDPSKSREVERGEAYQTFIGTDKGGRREIIEKGKDSRRKDRFYGEQVREPGAQQAPGTGRFDFDYEGLADARYRQQASQINAAYNDSIAQLNKAYQQAVAQGEIGKEEARRMYEQDVQQIQDNAYRAHEELRVAGQRRGIMSSAQQAGIEQGAIRFESAQQQQASDVRNQRITDINNRIAQLRTQRDIDVANLGRQRGLALAGAQAGIQADVMGKQFDVALGDYRFGQQLGAQQQMMQQQRAYQVEDALRNRDWQTADREIAREWQLEDRFQNREWSVQDRDFQANFAREMQDEKFKHALQQMAIGHSYNMQSLDKQQRFALEKMAKAFDYDMSKMDRTQKQQLAMWTLNRLGTKEDRQWAQDNKEYWYNRQRDDVLVDQQTNRLWEQYKALGYPTPDEMYGKTYDALENTVESAIGANNPASGAILEMFNMFTGDKKRDEFVRESINRAIQKASTEFSIAGQR